MIMEIGDIVNVKLEDSYWKGLIRDISDRSSDGILYSEPIAHIKGKNDISHAVKMESDMIFKDGEWWEVRI